MAVYPTIFTLYVGHFFPSMGAGGRLAAGILVIVLCGAWNLRGASGVGKGSTVLAVGLLAPFAIFSAAALFHAGPALPPSPPSTPHALFAGVMVAMWNYMGWDNASTIAAEVDRPERTYPLAMILTVILVALTYLVPVAGAAAAGIDPARGSTGAWVDAARAVGGRPLELGMVAGGIVCGFGMYNALLLSYSRVPMALAEDGLLPKWLAKTDPKTGAPVASIVACSLAYMACLGIGFSKLVELDVLLYGASLVLEFVALVFLRVREPELPRPFKLPGGLPGAVLAGVGPTLLLLAALWEGRDEKIGPVPTLALGGALALLGPIVYLGSAARRPS
jgi:amino acid transporter